MNFILLVEWVSEVVDTKGMICWNFDVKKVYGDLTKLRESPSQICMMMLNSSCPRMDLMKWFKRGVVDRRTSESSGQWVSKLLGHFTDISSNNL